MWFRKGLVAFVWVIAGCLIAFPTGCSEQIKRPKTAKVSGIVTYKGAPLPNADVVFMPGDSSASQPATGRTDEQGRFQLTTSKNNDGCIAGEKAVVIMAVDETVPTTPYNSDPSSADYVKRKSLIPKRYGNPTTSGLTATVEAGKKNTFEFNLTDKP
ncbi:MAG: hypothetical protein ACKO6B_07880 [Planctomycetia bacterium]